ncbi:MAG: bifunctional nuclease family protein [Flavobacteriaceae bacterium]|jgi:bifunctional DNase/RNase|nr:bifunctional nuclease family protein [Flavobacteriaceae bacterium]
MTLIRLTIKGISYSQTQSGAYALVLNEMDGERTLPIVIGAFEAQSIAIALEKDITPPRPLTHDLFKSFADQFQIIIKQIIIHKLVDGVFHSSLVCEREGKEEIIDARTSDAIALAIRFNAPIFTYQNILDKAGIILKLEQKESLSKGNQVDDFLENILIDEDNLNDYDEYTLEELSQKLREAVAHEDYELAAKIRDEIEKRNKK